MLALASDTIPNCNSKNNEYNDLCTTIKTMMSRKFHDVEDHTVGKRLISNCFTEVHIYTCKQCGASVEICSTTINDKTKMVLQYKGSPLVTCLKRAQKCYKLISISH